jgi:hypothetical protein
MPFTCEHIVGDFDLTVYVIRGILCIEPREYVASRVMTIATSVREIDSVEAVPALEAGDIDLAFARLDGDLGASIPAMLFPCHCARHDILRSDGTHFMPHPGEKPLARQVAIRLSKYQICGCVCVPPVGESPLPTELQGSDSG